MSKFCGEHRLPEDHACTFDYKAQGRELIAKKIHKLLILKLLKFKSYEELLKSFTSMDFSCNSFSLNPSVLFVLTHYLDYQRN